MDKLEEIMISLNKHSNELSERIKAQKEQLERMRSIPAVYWKERCLAAERLIHANLTHDEATESEAMHEWLEIKNKHNEI